MSNVDENEILHRLRRGDKSGTRRAELLYLYGVRGEQHRRRDKRVERTLKRLAARGLVYRTHERHAWKWIAAPNTPLCHETVLEALYVAGANGMRREVLGELFGDSEELQQLLAHMEKTRQIWTVKRVDRRGKAIEMWFPSGKKSPLNRR